MKNRKLTIIIVGCIVAFATLLCLYSSKISKNTVMAIKISPSKQGGGKVDLQYASAAELDMIVEILNQRKQLEKISQNTVFNSGGYEKEKFSIKFIE